MVPSNSGLLVELEAEIVELEGEIPDQATRDRLLAIPKKLFTEAQDYIRTGNAREARLTINCAGIKSRKGGRPGRSASSNFDWPDGEWPISLD
jgi:hypothetical protein